MFSRISSIFIAASLVMLSMFNTHTAHAQGSWVDIHVSTTGSANGDGSEQNPFATIAEAFEALDSISQPARIAIEPGVYREGGLFLNRSAWPTVIESTGPGQAIISGSDIWTDWEERGNKIVAPWTEDWGLDPLSGFPQRDIDNVLEAGQRSEMVFVDGELLTQVIEDNEMGPGTYRVDITNQELIVQLPEGKEAASSLIEVGIRASLLAMFRSDDVTLRRLTFQHAATSTNRPGGFDRWAVFFGGESASGATNEEAGPNRDFTERIVIEDCEFIWNNRGGLTFAVAKDVTIRRSHFDDNGVSGMSANRAQSVVIEDSTLNRNNWRLGLWGNVTGWAPAGTKMLFMDQLRFTRTILNDNYATGLWMDTAVNNLVVEDSDMIGNWGTGFYYEHNTGPAVIRNSHIKNNGFNDGSREILVADGGILFAESQGLTVDNCVVQSNANYEIGVRSRYRPGISYWSGESFDGTCRDLTVTNSLIVSKFYEGDNVPSFYDSSAQNSLTFRTSQLIGMQINSEQARYEDTFLPTYQGSGNRFYAAENPDFTFSVGGNIGRNRTGLSGWRSTTGQDLDSVLITSSPDIAAPFGVIDFFDFSSHMNEIDACIDAGW